MPISRTESEQRGEFQKNSSMGLRANDDSFIGESVMAKRFATAFNGVGEADEAILRSRKQDEEFCRVLRVAIQRGQESCPIGVSTEPGTKKPMVMKHTPLTVIIDTLHC